MCLGARARRVCAGVFVSRMQPRGNVGRSKLAKLNSKKNKERKEFTEQQIMLKKHTLSRKL